MPKPGYRELPQETIDKIVARHGAGESAIALADKFKVSRATIYAWIKEAKEPEMKRVKEMVLSPANVEKASKRDLASRIKDLESENARLWKKIHELMLKHGEL